MDYSLQGKKCFNTVKYNTSCGQSGLLVQLGVKFVE